MGTVRRLVPAALGSFTLSMIVAAAFAGLASRLAGVGFADALVAFAPGGLEAMMMLALVLGLDPLYVGVHHLARFLGIGFLVPFAVGMAAEGLTRACRGKAILEAGKAARGDRDPLQRQCTRVNPRIAGSASLRLDRP